MDQHTWDQSVQAEITRLYNAARAAVNHDLDGDTLETEYRPERLRDLDDLEVRHLIECACGSSHWTAWRSPTTIEVERYQDERNDAAEFAAEQSEMDLAEDRAHGF